MHSYLPEIIFDGKEKGQGRGWELFTRLVIYGLTIKERRGKENRLFVEKSFYQKAEKIHSLIKQTFSGLMADSGGIIGIDCSDKRRFDALDL